MDPAASPASRAARAGPGCRISLGSLLLNVALPLVANGAMLFGLARRMRIGERFPLRQFGERHRACMARTTRLVPGIW